MTVDGASRKRLWARSGNRCALCRTLLIEDDGDLPGAMIGNEAHIVARSVGGPRYEPLEASIRDGYDNVILLCANDHAKVDSQPGKYTVDVLHDLKRRHEAWVRSRLRLAPPTEDDTDTLAVRIGSGAEIGELLRRAMAYQCGAPTDVADADADLVDDALQAFCDWGEVADDAAIAGFRAVREGHRELQRVLDGLTEAGYAVVAGERYGRIGGPPENPVRARIAVVQIVRVSELDLWKAPSSFGQGGAEPDT